ncbi:Putative oligomeric Golgi complex subunit 1 protein [Septoria linicola]|uniref:Conserved oligomeric Golgi complex subunit 1 n=1 Tax=Septoria linicola TaxID=215465 RepID=A0A9Q9AM78_9PEZI|nr:Putative oligomeric Golgi complex subunit 1 protein [Septoria linicola]
MTSQPPDPKTLDTWEDAFQYPLPVVRKLEQQLRRNIDDNRQKLRSLVGASYRDLLGTAERIIDMDEQIQNVELNMADIGRKCNTRKLETIGENYASMKRERGKGDEQRLVRIAQTKVLQNAISVTLRTIKSGGDALVAAKLLILARLLHRSLTDSENGMPIVDDLRKKLGNARKRLLGYISRALSRARIDRASITHTLCAYALLSSASPKDVLRHFLKVRFEHLEAEAEQASEASLTEMLELYSKTLLDTKDLFPRRFVDALSHITTSTLVRDPEIRSIADLSLDIYERYITHDVRNFHPWARQDELSLSSVNEAAKSWTGQAQECLLRTLKEALSALSDAHAVLQLRQKFISKYLVLGTKLRQDTQVQSLSEIRKAFLDRLEALAEQAAAITDFDVDTQSQRNESRVPGVESLAMSNMDLARGTAQFRKDVLNLRYGRSSITDGPCSALDRWLMRLRSFGEVIATMRGAKWDDDLDLDLDGLLDDEPLQVILSKQEPQQLEKALHQATIVSLQKTYTTVDHALESGNYDPTLLIRILREVDDRCRGLADLIAAVGNVKSKDSTVAALHENVIAAVAAVPVKRYAAAIKVTSRVAVSLWDGTPPLPVQPSSTTFRFLKDLHQHMSARGQDLWSPEAVRALQGHLANSLDDKIMLAAIDHAGGMPLTNGHSDVDLSEAKTGTEEAEDSSRALTRNRVIQQFFDVQYLRRVLSHASSGSQLEKVDNKLRAQLDLDSGAYERLGKSATDYWRRTYFLFGLLATEQ